MQLGADRLIPARHGRRRSTPGHSPFHHHLLPAHPSLPVNGNRLAPQHVANVDKWVGDVSGMERVWPLVAARPARATMLVPTATVPGPAARRGDWTCHHPAATVPRVPWGGARWRNRQILWIA